MIGADHDTRADPTPGVADTAVGAPGSVVSVLDAAAVPVPATFVVVTVHVWTPYPVVVKVLAAVPTVTPLSVQVYVRVLVGSRETRRRGMSAAHAASVHVSTLPGSPDPDVSVTVGSAVAVGDSTIHIALMPSDRRPGVTGVYVPASGPERTVTVPVTEFPGPAATTRLPSESRDSAKPFGVGSAMSVAVGPEEDPSDTSPCREAKESVNVATVASSFSTIPK